MPYKSFQGYTSSAVPKANGPVVTSTCERLSIWSESYTCNRTCMSCEGFQERARSNIP